MNYMMKFLRQSDSLKVKNHDFNRELPKKHGALLPGSIRGIIAGSSNSGKTNLVISLLEEPNGLKFENIYIYGKCLEQEKYRYLGEILKPIKGIGYYTYTGEVISPSEAKPDSIMIFDDIICGNQDSVREYFCLGRHKSVDCLYLSQTYSKIPKQLIRDNANLIILFKQDALNLKHVYDDHVAADMSFEEFRSVCAECWRDKYGFIVIDNDSNINMGRYRKGFDCYISI